MFSEKPHNLKITASLQSCSIILNSRFFVWNTYKRREIQVIRKLGYLKKNKFHALL